MLTWIGNGAPVLIARALEWAKGQTGKDFSDAEMEQVKERFNVYYAENLCNVSRLYPNVKENIGNLKGSWLYLSRGNEQTNSPCSASIGGIWHRSFYSVKCLEDNHYPRLNHIQAHYIIYAVNLA